MSSARVIADSFYYLNNFESVMGWIADRYADILRSAETEFLSIFPTLPKVSRALLVRMIMRKRAMFLDRHLHYSEIGDLAAAMSPLLRLSWVDDHPCLCVDELFTIMPKADLVKDLRVPSDHAQPSKQALLEHCRRGLARNRPLEHWCAGFTDRVYHVRVAALCERFRLMYFGNFRQSWSEFVIAELGILSYETVECSLNSRPFQTPEQVDQFHMLYRCRQLLERDTDPHAVLSAMPTPIRDSDWLETRRQRVMLCIGQALERAGATAAALQVYSTITYPGAALRAIRIREKSDDIEGALALCDAALETERSACDVSRIQRARYRLRRRLDLPGVDPSIRQAVAPVFEVSLDKYPEHPPVEYLVRDALIEREGANSTVHYVENRLINALFGLLCWRAIYAPIPGAFFHRFHREPVDLSDASFHRRRESYFAECFAELDHGTYRKIIRDNYSEKFGIATSFVAWRSLNTALLETALTCLPAEHLKIWFQWIVNDVSSNRSGFPDLIQFWPQESRYRLVEVKAPGDRLQESQRRCLTLCVLHQIPVTICKVKWLH